MKTTNGLRNLEIERPTAFRTSDVAAWRQKFAGDDPENRDVFDGFALPGLITAAYAQAWAKLRPSLEKISL